MAVWTIPNLDNCGGTFSQLIPWGSNERLALAESTLRPTAFLFAAGAITKVGIQTRGDDASIYVDDDATNPKWLIATGWDFTFTHVHPENWGR